MMDDNTPVNESVNVYWSSGNPVKFLNQRGELVVELTDFVVMSRDDWGRTQKVLAGLGANIINRDAS